MGFMRVPRAFSSKGAVTRYFFGPSQWRAAEGITSEGELRRAAYKVTSGHRSFRCSVTLVSSTIKDDPSSYVLRTMDAAAQDGALVAQSKLGTANESACSLASDSSEGINLTSKESSHTIRVYSTVLLLLMDMPLHSTES